MTTEQIIVLGVLAAAFVAGWGVRALIARLDRDGSGGRDRETTIDEGLDRAVEESRRELEGAIRSYLSTVAVSLGARYTRNASGGGLADEVSAALQDDAANEAMSSIVGGEGGETPTERDLDLVDWGFAYGVAWARARERAPSAPADVVAREALRVAEAVYRAYAAEADWAGLGNGRATWPAPHE